MRLLVITLLALTACVAGGRAYAWGSVGHEVICEIAYRELTPAARTEVDRLIALDCEYETFRQSCMYADHVRSRNGARHREHYVNYPRDMKIVTSDGCGPKGPPCVSSAVKKDLARLRTKNISDKKKLKALKYLAHWVGDLHQPLHVSHSDDRGGNDIKVSGLCKGSLHEAWDKCLIEHIFDDRVDDIVNELHKPEEDLKGQRWAHTVMRVWADESFGLSRSPRLKYCIHDPATYPDGPCKYSLTDLEFSSEKRTVHIDQKYVDDNAGAVKSRLLVAGVRLGVALNAALEK